MPAAEVVHGELGSALLGRPSGFSYAVLLGLIDLALPRAAGFNLVVIDRLEGVYQRGSGSSVVYRDYGTDNLCVMGKYLVPN